LPGLFIPGAEGFEKWLDHERSRLRGVAQRAAAALIEQREADGDLPGAIEAASRAVELDPDAEQQVRRLMELLDGHGDSAQALAAYERLHGHLAAEYSSEPSAATNALAQRIRTRRQAVEPPPPVPGLPRDAERAAWAPTEGAPTTSPALPHPGWRRPRRLVAALVTVLAVTAVAWFARRDAAAPPAGRSLVLLPMVNETGDASLDYLATGITEDVARRLQGIGGLVTIHSAARAEWPSTTGSDLGLIGREFGSELGLRSRLLLTGDSLTVATEVVDIASGESQPVGQLKFTVATVHDLESRLAAAVAGTVFRRPIPEDPRGSDRPVDPESYRLTLQGWHALLTLQDGAEARRLFATATERDPSNARAWAGVSSVWSSAAVTWEVPFDEGYALAEAAALRALALDSLQGTALANLGILRGLRDRNLAAGIALLSRSFAVEPGNPELFLIEAALYRHAWRWEEARDAIRIARRLDPLNPRYVEREAVISVCTDQPEESLALYREAVRLNAAGPVRDGLARALARLGRWDEALEQLREGAAARRDQPALAALRAWHGESGYWAARAAVARPRLDALLAAAQSRWVSRARLGTLYIAVGELERGLDLLEHEARAGDVGILRLPCQPDVDRVRDAPRFKAILALASQQVPK
jgi:tetratricopeptide (TPR) repeat protein